MEPPKIIREVDPQEGRGCWMGCFGIGCLIIVVAFFGLIIGGWYSLMHTRLPLVMLEQAIEQDGKVKIEGLTGSVSKGVHIDELKFLTVDDEHWSVLRGIKFDYNGFFDMSRTGSLLVDQMTVDSGTIYAEIESPDDFMFDPGDLNIFDEFQGDDLSEFRVNLVQVNNLKIINLDTDYSIEIESASLRDFVAKGDEGLSDIGELEIKSNMLEVTTEPSTRWPDSPSAKRIRGKLQSKFSERMNQDLDFVIDLDFRADEGRRAIALFEGRWVQEFFPRARSIQLTDFSPGDYFKSERILPSHVNLTASINSAKAEDDEPSSPETSEEEAAWSVAPGASFQLGQTTFQIESVEGNRAPLRSVVGRATVNGDTIVADLRCRDYFQKGRIELKIGEQAADKTDWAHVIYGSDFESLGRDEQRILEATIDAWRSTEELEQPDSKQSDDEPKVESEDETEADTKAEADAEDSTPPNDESPK